MMFSIGELIAALMIGGLIVVPIMLMLGRMEEQPPAPVAPEIHYHLHYHAAPALPAADAQPGLVVRNGERPAALIVPDARRLEVR